MTTHEVIEKNIALTFDFIRYLIQHSEMLDTIPDGAEIEFLEFDLPMHISENVPADSNKAVFFKVEHIFSKIAIRDSVEESRG